MTPSSTKISTDLPLKAGQVLEGKFRVEKIIGEGAMGLVVEATHLALDERVALKFLRRDAREQPEIVARFGREARAAAKIKSDHVARVYDVGNGPEGSPFIVMEYLEGRDLEQILQAQGRFSALDAVEHVIEACDGLAAAHSHGIIHRDIKPGNLYLSTGGGRKQIKVLDFGISKAGFSGTFEDIDVGLAHTTQIMGSPHYMSPEQIRSTKDVDQRADIWSLGVLLFELLAGETPFTATDVTGIIAQVLYEPHQKIRSLVPDLPEGLEHVIDRCLEKEASQRFATAADLAVALVPYAPKRARALVERLSAMATHSTGKPLADSLPPPPMSGSSTGSSLDPPAASQAVVLSTPPKKKGAVAWLAIGSVVLGLAGVCFALVTRGSSSSSGSLGAVPTETAQGEKSPATTASIVPEPTPHGALTAAASASTGGDATAKAGATARIPQGPLPGKPGVKAVPTTKASASARAHGERGDSSENEIRLER